MEAFSFDFSDSAHPTYLEPFRVRTNVAQIFVCAQSPEVAGGAPLLVQGRHGGGGHHHPWGQPRAQGEGRGDG